MGGLAACGATAQQPHLGPQLGESTAPGPTFGDAPAPDSGGVQEVSARVHGQMTPVQNPVIAVDTMPSTTTGTSAPAGAGSAANGSEMPNATFYAPGVVVPGATKTAVSASTPAGATSGNPVGTGTAGPNGPGTGNGPATATTPQPGTTQVPMPTPSPITPATPAPSPATPQPVQPQPVSPIPVTPR